jgi:hypothetical protein
MDMPASPSARALELARSLVRMNTVSRESNLELIHFIRDELARHGVASTLTFDDEKKKANLFATVGAGKRAGVIVSGHTDTVPWDGQDWALDPLWAHHDPSRPPLQRSEPDMKSFIGLAVAQVPAYPRRRSAVRRPPRLQLRRGSRLLRRAAPDRRPARARHPAVRLHRRRADRDGAGAGAQGRLPPWRCCVQGRPRIRR